MAEQRDLTRLAVPKYDRPELRDAMETLKQRKGITPRRILWVCPDAILYEARDGSPKTAHFFLDEKGEQAIEILEGFRLPA